MHFAVLSVTMLIASSALAVCARPMNVESARSSTQPQLAPRVTLTFLDPRTGKQKTGSPNLGGVTRRNFGTAIKNTLRMNDLKIQDINYQGSNALSDEQENILYFELNGGRCQPQCFGWITLGPYPRSIHWHSNARPRTREVYYAGVSLGGPGLHQFEVADCVGFNPPAVGRLLVELVRDEWNIRRNEARLVFAKLFMRGHLLPTNIRLAEGSSILTFISGQTGEPTSSDVTKFANKQSKSAFTRKVSAALGLKQEIQYFGTLVPRGKRQWFYFIFIGGPHCTTDEPCFGWIAKGVYVRADRPMVVDQRFGFTYLGISKGKPGPRKFSAIEGYPIFESGKVAVALKQTHAEWALIAEEFDDHFMGHNDDPDSFLHPSNACFEKAAWLESVGAI
ncbi:hypothetical protein BDP27DRAFT_1430390 [Rhodocollybia butyracea]|uniref:Uncharacterized protein n=1 Tax=Rhodocollybia butyracea TaxID=206335 RepID=A0A9P5TZE5_9AGAR|nr:hypothetical protein BDP27DRAFT_1430390 [Rhodocollybia butyracea]